MNKVNYLNNKDLLEEIHKSKSSYSSFVKPEYHEYHLILANVSNINTDTIIEAKAVKAKKMAVMAYEQKKLSGDKKIKLSECAIDLDSIDKSDLVFRIMTFDHIPLAPGRKKKTKTRADEHEKVNFPPFQHWKFNDEGNLVCVGKSHWIGGMENGHFSKDHGQFSNKLCRMFLKLCDKYATRSNFRGYTYNEEMKGQAILQLTQVGLQFDESKSNNPFAYFTAVVTNSFVRVINIEKKNQVIRDDILEMNNLSPSYTRQSENDWQQHADRTTVVVANKD
jgi:hypothetical protein